MATVPFDIPAGVVRHGTDSESAGRWRDVNYVRWENGSLRPIGGWHAREDRTDTANTVEVTLGTNVKARAALAWKSTSGTAWIAAGSFNNLFSINEAGTVTSILTSTISGATDGAAENVGYGKYLYGKGFYGEPRPTSGVLGDGSTWSLDSWGEYLVAVNSHDGVLRQWTLTGTADQISTTDSAFPANNDSVVVTEERFLFALGADNDPAKIKWCDREDNTTWTPSATNEAGDIILDTVGKIQLGLQVRGRTLILTTTDAHVATYSGPPAVYGFEKVGSNCGAVSRHCAVAHEQGAFWMGTNGFYFYDGQSVRDIPCDVQDYVFKGMNFEQQGKIYAVKNSKFNEIWWFYPSTSTAENDRYVYYDYKENHWGIGILDRTAGVDAGVHRTPIWFSATGKVYDHETGYTHEHTDNEEQVFSYAESGPVEAGQGERIINVTKVIPDHKAQGEYNLVFKTRNYPNDPETTKGPFSATSPTNVRLQGRQFRLRIDPNGKEINYYDLAQEALKVAVGIQSPYTDVYINGRHILDINDDGDVSASDSSGILAHGAGTQNYDWITNEVIPYTLANYPATAVVFDVTYNTQDWTLGNLKLETKLGGAR